MRRIFKIQMNNNAGTNYVDEVIADNRITAHIDFAKEKFLTLQAGEIVLVHRSSTPLYLVEIVERIENPNEIVGESFGIDYRVKILSSFEDIPINHPLRTMNGQIGFNGTFQELGRNTTTYQNLLMWYNLTQMQEKIEVLKHKKQIILQGPPGTGKTRLAVEMAKELTQVDKVTPIDKVNDFFRNFSETDEIILERQKIANLLEQFQSKFPKNNIDKMSLDKYVLGTEEKDGFCYWLEYKLKESGLYSGQANKWKIRWNEDEGKYLKSGFLETESDDDKAMKKLAELIKKIVDEDFSGDFPLGKGYVLKVLNSYYPERYFPVNSENCINNALKLLKIEDENLTYIEKNKELQTFYQKKTEEYNSAATSIEFMRFLFSTFGLKNEIIINNDELVLEGEYKIIQFHPAYTYEDFVRGITAKSGEKGLEYKTENKALAKIAQNAVENPLANYVLIIDEINRANLPSVLGELIYALEYRNEKVESMYTINSDATLILPENLFIIGTMNTADRSVGTIDYAIRRRFSFVDILPSFLENSELEGKVFARNSFRKVSSLFISNIEEYETNSLILLTASEYLVDGFNPKDVWLGHSYFIHNKGDFNMHLNFEIKPILREYVQDGILKQEALEIINSL